MELLRIIWGHIMKLPKTKIDDMVRGSPDQITDDKYYSSSVLFVAAEMGNTAFVVELIRQYPEQVLALNDNKQSIFHVAVTHRYRGIYSLLHVLGSMKESIVDLEDENGNNMLHLVGILSKTTRSDYLLKDIPGPAAQLLTDLAWFQVRISLYLALIFHSNLIYNKDSYANCFRCCMRQTKNIDRRHRDLN